MALTILVVDDEPIMRSLLARMLIRLNATAVEAASGPEAEGMIAEVKPDLVLLDIMMPEQDGYTTCQHLRTQGYTGRVVMVTAISPEAGLRKALDAGANDYMQKPVNRDALQGHIDAVEAALAKRRATEDN